jgi:glycosyltransferase involved in cell wall biosynthesis
MKGRINMSGRIRILVLASHYLPGYKGGGPIRSISGMIASLGDEFEFRVLTSDRDLGDTAPYPSIVHSTWMPVGKAHVMYLPRRLAGLGNLVRVIRKTAPDIVYITGGLDPVFVLRPLLLHRLGLTKIPSIILAPQGVFSEGALRIKSYKKRLFLALARRIGLYENLTWHVSTEFEKGDVQRALPLQIGPHFIVASDITPICSQSPFERHKSSAWLQVVFLSRISPKKNLDGALRILQGVDVPIDFHIYGTVEDEGYWRLCEDEIRKLPPNVSATHHGPIPHDNVARVMRSHDLFFLPTHGENFGHVIIEALREGCPVLIANNTAFRRLEEKNAGWDLPIGDVEGFRNVLRKCAAMSQEEWLHWSEGARRLAAQIAGNSEVTDRYRLAFRQLAAKQNVAWAA